jgi:leucyl aminopeptidase (aminopeptidase T)
MPAAMLPEYPESKMRGLARNVLQNTLRMKRGENLLIETWSATLPWATSFVVEARILGARPMLVVEDEEAYWKSVAEAPAANVGYVGSHDWAALKASDAHMYFYGPLDTAKEDALPRSIIHRIDAADHEWFRLTEKFGVRSARWDLGRTSERLAERYGVDLDRWRRELVEAASLDPHGLQKDGRRVGELFRRGRTVRITHPNGTDLELRLAGRVPRVDDGVIDETDLREGNAVVVVPSGVTTVSVDESWAEGTFVSNTPGVMFSHGDDLPLRGGEWTFQRGHLIHFAFESGEDRFRRELTRSGAGADRPGLVAIGLNSQISSIPLLFDQVRGAVTFAIGRNAHVGGKSRSPRFSAYQSLQGATVEVDGKVAVDQGSLPP